MLVPFGESAVPVGRRVAQVLKYAKRAMGMRCVEVSSYTPTEQLERLTDELIALRRLNCAAVNTLTSQRLAREPGNPEALFMAERAQRCNAGGPIARPLLEKVITALLRD